MTLRQQFAEVLKGTWRVIRRHPWMLAFPAFLVWHVVHTPEERRRFLDAAIDGGDTP